MPGLIRFEKIMERIPSKTIEYAFAYGSGAIQQQNEDKLKKMIDFVFVTNDAKKFHTENLKKNPTHYSMISRLTGPSAVEKVQRNWGARVHYNTRLLFGPEKAKYGVISYEDLKEDLLDWKWLYIAGRLQKPVVDVIGPNENIADLVTENRRSALHASLLLLPDSFNMKQLFTQIVGLSYNGDFRMIIGEDRNKIQKIVEGNFEELLKVYEPLIGEDARLSVINHGKIIQDGGTAAIYHRLNLLPSEVLQRIQRNLNRSQKRQGDTEEVIFALAHRHDVADTVSSAIKSIVRPVSISQTAKNALTAGFTRSLIYSVEKMHKFITSSKRETIY